MAWKVVYYKKANGDVSAEAFLDSCPVAVEAKIEAVLTAVADAAAELLGRRHVGSDARRDDGVLRGPG